MWVAASVPEKIVPVAKAFTDRCRSMDARDVVVPALVTKSATSALILQGGMSVTGAG